MVSRHVLAVQELVVAQAQVSGLMDQVIKITGSKAAEHGVAAKGFQAIGLIQCIADGD